MFISLTVGISTKNPGIVLELYIMVEFLITKTFLFLSFILYELIDKLELDENKNVVTDGHALMQPRVGVRTIRG